MDWNNFPRIPGRGLHSSWRINWQLQHFMKINKTLSNEAEMNRLALWSSSHSTNHPHTFLIYLTHSGIYPSFILLQHYTALIRHHVLKLIPPNVHCVYVCVDVWTLEHFNVERWIILWNVSPITQLYNPIRYCFMRLVWHKMIHENSFKINLGYINHQRSCYLLLPLLPRQKFWGGIKKGQKIENENKNSASESCMLDNKCINFDALIVSVS